MPTLLSACGRLIVCASVLAAPMLAQAQQTYGPQGSEYKVLGPLPLPGDQMFSDLALGASAGYLVWQDNSSDSDGLGISAQRLDQSLSGAYTPFRLNLTTAGNQEQPKVAMLQSGGAVFVWRSQMTNICARIANSRGVLSPEIIVNTQVGEAKQNPVVTVLKDGTVVVAWSADNQDGSMQGVFAQRLSASGAKIGAEIAVNSLRMLNQRNPAIAALDDGGYVVSWIHEAGSTSGADMDIYARIFTADGAASKAEFKLNKVPALSANPALIATPDGFIAAWSHRKKPVLQRTITAAPGGEIGTQVAGSRDADTNSWDIFSRSYTLAGLPKQSEPITVNTYLTDPQFAPNLARLGDEVIAVWTSRGQDGSQDGVYGRFMNSELQFSGPEFRVNTTTRSRQIHPTVATTSDRFLVAWSCFVGGPGSFELLAQRYERVLAPLEAPSAPTVSALSQSRLSVGWPAMPGLEISTFLLSIDGDSPIEVANNFHIVTHLPPKSSHSFVLKYRLSDGRISPPSATATGVTWDEDANDDRLPDDWQTAFWGASPAAWPSETADSDNDGAPNLQEFWAGTDPTNANSILKTSVTSSTQGVWLNWNTVAGSIYQVQSSADLNNWNNLSEARFATGESDSLLLSATTEANQQYYRVIRLR